MAAVKSLLHETGTVLTIENTPSVMGGIPYCLSVARLTLAKDGTSVTASAFARESTADVKTSRWTESKSNAPEIHCEQTVSLDQIKGGQGSGAAISYAQKYALGALFLIDDSVDLDSTMAETTPTQPQPQQRVDDKGHDVMYYVETVLTRVANGELDNARKGIDCIAQTFPDYNLANLRKIVNSPK